MGRDEANRDDKGAKEFRVRLEGIAGAMQMLLDTELSPEQRAIAAGTRERALSLVTMLDALSSLTASGGSESSKRPEPSKVRPLDVLVCEDNDINARIVARVLGKLGAKFRRAVNGAEGLAACEQHFPDLILMDIKMPVMDGYEATRELRHRYGTALPIVALTSNVDQDDRYACFEAGMDQFLAKPFSTEELAALLDWVRARSKTSTDNTSAA